MKRFSALIAVTVMAASLAGCPAPERDAYNAIVAAKAFTDSVKVQHPECTAPASTPAVCIALRKAISAKDVIIDAAEVYCAGPHFNGGGTCDPPVKGSPAYVQALNKLSAAVSAYSLTEADLKGVIR